MRILFLSDIIVFVRKAENLATHKHYAIQILLSKHPLIVNGKESYKRVIINSNVEHCIESLDQCISLFIEPKSIIGKNIVKQLKNNSIAKLDIQTDILDLISDEISNDQIEILTKVICDSFKSNMICDDRIISVINYIDSNCQNDLSIKQLADYCYLSPTRFTHLFKQETGLSVMRYLTWVRMIMAAKYVYVKRAPISEAAYQFNFSDEAHFCTTFKKAYGINLKKVISEIKTFK